MCTPIDNKKGIDFSNKDDVAKGKIGKRDVVDAKNRCSKNWYIVAVLIGALVIVGLGGFGTIGLLQSYGLTLPNWLQWLTPAIGALGNTSHFWSLWTIAVGGVLSGSVLLAFGAYKIHQNRQSTSHHESHLNNDSKETEDEPHHPLNAALTAQNPSDEENIDLPPNQSNSHHESHLNKDSKETEDELSQALKAALTIKKPSEKDEQEIIDLPPNHAHKDYDDNCIDLIQFISKNKEYIDLRSQPNEFFYTEAPKKLLNEDVGAYSLEFLKEHLFSLTVKARNDKYLQIIVREAKTALGRFRLFRVAQEPVFYLESSLSFTPIQLATMTRLAAHPDPGIMVSQEKTAVIRPVMGLVIFETCQAYYSFINQKRYLVVNEKGGLEERPLSTINMIIKNLQKVQKKSHERRAFHKKLI